MNTAARLYHLQTIFYFLREQRRDHSTKSAKTLSHSNLQLCRTLRISRLSIFRNYSIILKLCRPQISSKNQLYSFLMSQLSFPGSRVLLTNKIYLSTVPFLCTSTFPKFISLTLWRWNLKSWVIMFRYKINCILAQMKRNHIFLWIILQQISKKTMKIKCKSISKPSFERSFVKR